MNPSTRRLIAVAALFASSSAALAVQWSGYSTGNNNWSDATNWYLFDRPDNNSSDEVNFYSDTPRRTSTVNQDYAIGKLWFDEGLFSNQGMTVNGSGTLGLKSGIDSRSSSGHTISAPIRLDGTNYFRNDLGGGDSGYLYISSTINLNGNNLGLIPGANSMALAGAISGSGSIYVSGVGYANFEAPSGSWTGTLVVNKGTVQYDDDAAFGAATNGIYFNQTDDDYVPTLQRNSTGTTGRVVHFEGANEGSIAVPSGRIHTFTGSFSGTGVLGKTGAGTAVLAGTSGAPTTGGGGFNGKVLVRQGTLQLSGGAHLPINRVTVESGATLLFDPGVNDSIGTLYGRGTLQLGTGTRVGIGTPGDIVGDRNGTGNWQGQIVGNNVTVTKNGTGTLNVTQSNVYSGTTEVIGGTLYADNAAGSATGTSAVSVSNFGTLTGTGGIAGTVTVAGGGTLAPGFHVDAQTYGGLAVQPGGKLNVDLNAVAIDRLTVTGNATLSGGAVNFVSANGISIINAAPNREFLRVNGTITGAFTVANARQPNGTYLAVTYGPHSAYVSLARAGDANLDGSVGFADLVALAQRYDAVATGRSWAGGDFDGNGITSFADLVLLAQNYGSAGAAPGGDLGTLPGNVAADWALAQSIVPEPTTIAMLAGVAAITLRRRR